MAGRFEPTKSGEYVVEYLEDNHWIKEPVRYDKKKETWIGTKTPEWYKEHIRSWYY